MNLDECMKFKLVKLKTIAVDLGLRISGNKTELCDRIKDHLEKNPGDEKKIQGPIGPHGLPPKTNLCMDLKAFELKGL